MGRPLFFFQLSQTRFTWRQQIAILKNTAADLPGWMVMLVPSIYDPSDAFMLLREENFIHIDRMSLAESLKKLRN